MITLIRIDDSGIFALPECAEGEISKVYADGTEIEFTATDNGNIDVTEYNGKAVITAELI